MASTFAQIPEWQINPTTEIPTPLRAPQLYSLAVAKSAKPDMETPYTASTFSASILLLQPEGRIKGFASMIGKELNGSYMQHQGEKETKNRSIVT